MEVLVSVFYVEVLSSTIGRGARACRACVRINARSNLELCAHRDGMTAAVDRKGRPLQFLGETAAVDRKGRPLQFLGETAAFPRVLLRSRRGGLNDLGDRQTL